MTIGVITAEEKEMLAVRNLMDCYVETTISNLIFYDGSINGIGIILCESGVGKVNAARTVQCLVDYYKPIDYLINVGVAGGIDDSLKIGDIVVGDRLIQYDFDATKVGNYEIGEICGLGTKYFNSDVKLVDFLMSLELGTNITKGLIGSADLFLSDRDRAKMLNTEMGIKCVEMEGASIAQVATLNRIPFVVIRGISDVQNDNNKIDFDLYLETVSIQVADIFRKILTYFA